MFSTIRSPIAGEKGRRLVSLIAGMKLAGIARLDEHLVILSRPLSYGYQTLYMVKKTPFNSDEVSAIDRIADSRGAKITILFPDVENVIGRDGFAHRERTEPRGRGVTSWQSKNLPGDKPDLWSRGNTDGPEPTGRSAQRRPAYLVGSGLMSRGSRFESVISGLYAPLLKVMGVLAFVFLLLPFIVRRRVAEKGEDRSKACPDSRAHRRGIHVPRMAGL